MSPEQLATFNFPLAMIGKLFLLVLALFYFIFTVVVYRQIDLMVQVLDSRISPFVKTVALIQIGAAAVLFFLVLILA